jgi:hypothetical protein
MDEAREERYSERKTEIVENYFLFVVHLTLLSVSRVYGARRRNGKNLEGGGSGIIEVLT